MVCAGVEAMAANSPPASPALGSCYILGGAPTGAWSGKVDHLAAYSAGGWRFIAPFDGLSALIKGTGVGVTYRSGAWEQGVIRANSVVVGGQQVVGARTAAIADPSGGSTIDGAARTAISAVLSALRAHGLIAG